MKVDARLRIRKLSFATVSLILVAIWTTAFYVPAQERTAIGSPPSVILFQNVRIFDGKNSTLSGPENVMVRGNKIAQISTSAIDSPPGATVIDGGGRTLMPGLIDAHYHLLMATLPIGALATADVGYINLLGGVEADHILMRGFTSIRDVAGPVFGLKRAIDEGMIPGPRIWPSGAMISQTGGHADFRMRFELPKAANAPLSHAEILGTGAIADGPDEVLLRTREQLMLGASQIKLAAGGGVSSNYDPLDSSQYIEAEFRAAVEAAELGHLRDSACLHAEGNPNSDPRWCEVH